VQGIARGRAVGVALLIGFVGVACGDDAGTTLPVAAPVEAPSPFAAGPVPPDLELELVAAGTGGRASPWGSDANGTDEPFTVLAPEGAAATDPRVVVVSSTGFAGYEGGLSQASPTTRETAQPFTLDGRDAIFAAAGRRAGPDAEWADVVVRHGDDLALRARSRGASRAELVEVVRQVRPGRDRNAAPTVPDPPRGLHVVGSVDARVVTALQGDANPLGGRGLRWSTGFGVGSTSIAVTTLPPRSAGLAAIPGFVAFVDWEPTVAAGAIAGRPAWTLHGAYVDQDGDVYAEYRAVVTHTGTGALVVVVARGGTMPTEAEMVALAASVRPATPDEWSGLVGSVASG
jgi:hypothetical protein